MAIVYEGVMGFWSHPTTPYERRVRFVFRADYAADTLYIRSVQHDGRVSGDVTQKISDIARALGLPVPSGLIVRLAQGPQDLAGLKVLGNLTAQIGLGGLPSFSIEMPGTSLLKSGKHCKQLRYEPVGGIAADFTGADLSGVHFEDVDLRQAIFTNTKLSGARIERCQFAEKQLKGLALDGVNFVDQRLSDLDLSGATLDGSDFSGALFSGCRFDGAKMKGIKVAKTGFAFCTFAGTNLDGTKGTSLGFMQCDLSRATFDDAAVDGWYFPMSTLKDTSFKRAKLTNACFTRLPKDVPLFNEFEPPVLDGIHLDSAALQGTDFTDVDLAAKAKFSVAPVFGTSASTRTKLVRAKFKLSFLGSNCAYVDATDATITYDVAASTGIEDFVAAHAILPVMQLAGFRLSNADFSNAYLRGGHFGNARLADAKFTGAVLEGADFSGARLEGADFESANLIAANFTSAWLYGAKFKNTILGDTNFSSAMLAQVSFAELKGRALAGVNFSNACLVAADFKAVSSTVSGSKRTSFAGACLAGTDFSNAQLADVAMTNAQTSKGNGSIAVKFEGLSDRTFDYEATRIAPNATGPQTICPDGNGGQCSVERLFSKPVKAAWP